jgi:predicted metal-binding protein
MADFAAGEGFCLGQKRPKMLKEPLFVPAPSLTNPARPDITITGRSSPINVSCLEACHRLSVFAVY